MKSTLKLELSPLPMEPVAVPWAEDFTGVMSMSIDFPDKKFANESLYERFCRAKKLIAYSEREQKFSKFLAIKISMAPYMATSEEITEAWEMFTNEVKEEF